MNTKTNLSIYILLVLLYTLVFGSLIFLWNPLVYGEEQHAIQKLSGKRSHTLTERVRSDEGERYFYDTSSSFLSVQGVCKRVFGPFVTQNRAYQVSKYYLHQGYRTYVSGSVLRGEYYVYVFYPDIFCKY